jgi:putative tryptophan/tyrosine transport system substrate-binding protein
MAIGIARRQFISALGGATLAWPLAARAQQRAGPRRLGVLMGYVENDPEGQSDAAAFVRGLGALNWKEGSNLRIDWRWGDSDPALFERYAAELIALGPELLLAGSSSTAVAALRRQTNTIPIVFANITDPVGQGVVVNLAHPGGNVTGFSNYDPQMAGKWLEMLTQLTPPVAHVATLYNPATAPYAPLLLHAIEVAAPSLAVAVRAAPVKDDAEIEAAMMSLAREERGGLLVLPDAFNNAHRDAIVALAARHRVPAVYPFRFFAVAGGLMSYGIDLIDLYRRSADYVDRLLKGTAPADLPVQAPVNFKMVVNLKTAKALGLTIPPTLLVAADEVIE